MKILLSGYEFCLDLKTVIGNLTYFHGSLILPFIFTHNWFDYEPSSFRFISEYYQSFDPNVLIGH